MAKLPSATKAGYWDNTDSGDTLIKAADHPLYLVMRQGCNRVVRSHAGKVKGGS